MTPASPSVVVFGSLHYDIMVHGPARPRKGETVAGERWYPKCGGKGGNQAIAAAGTGMRAVMIGAVADDDFGQVLTDNLARNGVDIRFVRTVTGVGTGMSVAIFDGEGDYGAVIVSGSNLTLGEADVDAAREVWTGGSVLLLQNEVPDHANVSAARAMKSAGGTVVLNAAPARPPSADLERLVDILVVNAIEAEQLAGLAVVETLSGAMEAAERLSETFPVAVVTAGGHGVACARQGGEVFSIAAIEVELVSTHGAGDEFTGVLASELARGSDIRGAAEAANRAAAVLVGTPRTG
jgi:ribokinase